MNGLERSGDDGLFYNVVEIEQLAVEPEVTVGSFAAVRAFSGGSRARFSSCAAQTTTGPVRMRRCTSRRRTERRRC